MRPAGRGSPGPVVRALCAAVLVCAAGACRESVEERAARAYDSLDFAAARTLAGEIAAAGNPRGHELLALMAAQGLGQPVDYAAALAAIGRAVAADPGFEATRAAILDRIAADRAGAEAAFEAGHYERAWRLAKPLAAFGDETGKAVETALVTGHYVALPGSDMSWRSFQARCGGNTRFEDESRSQAVFDSECRGRPVTWDGTVIRSLRATVQIKMRPGRPGSRPDLELVLAREGANGGLAMPGAKVRFSGIVAWRGDPGRADRLEQARLVGPAPLTPGEAARAEARRRQTAAGACQKLAAAAFRAGHMPEWALETERLVVAGGSPRSRAFSLQAGILSDIGNFRPAAGGGWRGVFDGTVTLQSTVARTAEVTRFTAECAIDAAYRKGADPAAHGTLTFLALSPPEAAAPPPRARRRQR